MLRSEPARVLKSPFRLSPDERWYIVRTAPRAERRAADELQQLGLRVYVPKRLFRPASRRKTNPKPRRAPLLVGYVLVKFPPRLIDQRRQPLFGIINRCRHVPGPYVTYLDGRGDQVPMPLSSDDIDRLRERRQGNEFNEIKLAESVRAERLAKLRAAMKDGSRVLLVAGLYTGHIATLARINDDFSADITIHLIGRDTKLHVDDATLQIEPLVKSKKGA